MVSQLPHRFDLDDIPPLQGADITLIYEVNGRLEYPSHLHRPRACPRTMPDTLSTTLGAIEMGTMASAILYGMVTVQVYMYAAGCMNDRAWMKALVAFVW
jgi:hypothetical protein